MTGLPTTASGGRTDAAAESGTRWRRSTFPAWHALSLIAGIGALALSAGPLIDPDVYWHTLAGAYTLAGEGFPVPDPWSFSLPDARWYSLSLLGEAVLAATYDLAGYTGILVLRVAVSAAVLAVLYRLLVPRSRGWAGPVTYTVVALPLVTYLQERPQTASLLFVVWLAARAHAARAGQAPHRWRFVAMTYLWATVHGLFVLAPALLVLVAVGALLDDRRAARPVVRQLLTTAAIATVACALTPVGPKLLLAPLTVGAAARGSIAEWQPTELLYTGSWGFGAVLLLLALAWSRGTAQVPRSELLWVVALAALGFSAFRNAGPASILLAPLAVQRMSQTWRTESSLVLPRVPVAVLGATAALAALASCLTTPALPDSKPQRIAARLAAQPATVRVLNDYNVSGYLLREAWPQVRLFVDGRAERYGATFLADYDDMVAVRDGWQAQVAALDADVAVLRTDAPLTQLLVRELTWTTAMVDGSWTLLTAPGARLAP